MPREFINRRPDDEVANAVAGITMAAPAHVDDVTAAALGGALAALEWSLGLAPRGPASAGLYSMLSSLSDVGRQLLDDVKSGLLLPDVRDALAKRVGK